MRQSSVEGALVGVKRERRYSRVGVALRVMTAAHKTAVLRVELAAADVALLRDNHSGLLLLWLQGIVKNDFGEMRDSGQVEERKRESQERLPAVVARSAATP